MDRFTTFTAEELDNFLHSEECKNTLETEKFGVKVFNDYLECTNNDLQNVSDESMLDRLLAHFYASAKNQKGELYTKASMNVIKYSLQRYFKKIFQYDINNIERFPTSTQAFKVLGKKLKSEGKAIIKHKEAISPEDFEKIEAFLDTDTPEGLQRKIFINILIYFANRGRENLRSLKPSNFIFETGDDGRMYVMLKDNATKNHQDDGSESQGGRMCEVPNTDKCPVKLLRKYLSKLNPKCQFFFQKPKRDYFNINHGVWYDNVPVGKDILGNMLKKISNAANCSKTYTNHCLRATTISLLNDKGYTSRDIMTVSGHHSETSIKNYCKTSSATKRKMSDEISNLIVNESSSNINIDASFSKTCVNDGSPKKFDFKFKNCKVKIYNK